MINGRRRDHGAERAYIDIAEVAPIGGGLAKLNPLAYWTLEDCFDYAAANGVPLHPTVALGYPSQGDEKDTVPVPDPDGLSGFKGDAGSVKFVDGKWTGDKAIWLDYGNERKGRFGAMVVYAPWCQFCQGMEEAYEAFAKDAAAKGITVAKYRGDEDRDFVSSKFNTESFPTINVIKGGKATKYESEDRSVEALSALV